MVQEVKKVESQGLLGNSLKLAGEVFIPGSAQMLEGRILSGLGHNVLAGLTMFALGGLAPLAAGLIVIGVKANSFSQSVNDQNLWQLITGAEPTAAATPSPSGPSSKP